MTRLRRAFMRLWADGPIYQFFHPHVIDGPCGSAACPCHHEQESSRA